MALQPDGKIVAAGDTWLNGSPVFALARYNPTGSLDASFDGDGVATTPIGGFPDAVAVQPDGKIVAAGATYGSTFRFALIRYNPDGSLDSSFDGDGTVTTAIDASSGSAALALQPDGKILAAGSSGDAGHTDHVNFALARYCGGDPCDAVPASITVKKSLRPSADPGRFTLLVDSTVVKTAAGDGGQGARLGAAGTHRIAEVSANGANLSNYVSSISCTNNGAPDVSGSGNSILVTVGFGDVEVCTITNQRRATVTLRKALSPVDDPGRFDLKVGSHTVAAAVGDGGSGSQLVTPGSLKVSETAAAGPGLSAYSSSIACTRNGAPGPSGPGTSLTLTAGPGDLLDCTFTNVRTG